ncbi:hypothetical protein GLOIN_2v1871734 [Rhizophagus irregularis DAOM 181602=DAOM 197198]|nr:hypothetical protein GLOIN_2v1871734 [Rhizophagus irregularis DAOM 181602=DAOM 197198]
MSGQSGSSYKVSKCLSGIANAVSDIFHTLKKNVVSREDEIERLKAELEKCRDHLELKEEALVVQDKSNHSVGRYKGRVPLTQTNLDILCDDTNHFLDLIRQDATSLQNSTLDLRTLKRQNLANIATERDQYQNLLNKENREYWEIAENRKRRINDLLMQNFALQLLNQRKNWQITVYRRNIRRWTQINNLQQKILILQNNGLLNQQPGMAWYPPPRFSDSAHEDVDNFIKDFRLYVTASGMTTNNAAGKQRVLAFFELCLTGKAADCNIAAEIALNNANIIAAHIAAPDGSYRNRSNYYSGT